MLLGITNLLNSVSLFGALIWLFEMMNIDWGCLEISHFGECVGLRRMKGRADGNCWYRGTCRTAFSNASFFCVMFFPAWWIRDLRYIRIIPCKIKPLYIWYEIPVAARSKACACGSSLTEIVGSNSSGGNGCLSGVSVVCWQVSATSWSLVQRSHTDCGVSEYNREALIMRRP